MKDAMDGQCNNPEQNPESVPGAAHTQHASNDTAAGSVVTGRGSASWWATEWMRRFFSKSEEFVEPPSSSRDGDEIDTNVPPVSLPSVVTEDKSVVNSVRMGIASVFILAIRSVSAERDRDEILRWFLEAREILAKESPNGVKSKELYQSTSALRLSQLLVNALKTSLSNYYGANLPLALKVAIPVTVVSGGFLGMQGAGIAAFGTGIGLPVVLMIFLGTAGATTIVEAFVKDRSVRDPLTKLLLTFVAYESARRARKELLDAMRADAMVPKRSPVPKEVEDVLTFLMEMDPVEFERHVMSFFEEDGHPTGLTSRSNDFGVDGYIFHPDGVIVVQCKRHSLDNPVGRPVVQQFKGVIEEQRAFRGYIVTTSRFTEEAKESAAKSSRIILIDGNDLVTWHQNGRRQI
ncbi:MAG: restriction endonuclease [Planctomycetota bacterium]|jgi:restriction system protein|nr:MAG: restriction endonuclease [Planctomycetota bacterium]